MIWSHLGDIPVVNATIRVTSGEDLNVSIRGSNVWLRVVNIILMGRVSWLHSHRFVKFSSIEESSLVAESILLNSALLEFSKALVK